MDLSNASCEYFYDEEYDVASKEGTYNQSFLSSFNNNYYQFVGGKENHGSHFNRDYLTTSRLWSECLMENSGNNNYQESNDGLGPSIYKCKSIDNALDTSKYSLSKDLPFLNQNGDNSFNYRLYFEKEDLIDRKCNFDIRKQFAKRYNSKTFIDSGKCSAATSDSLIHPFKYYRNELANSENNLNETSLENRKEANVNSHRKKSSKQLWRKLKNVFSSKRFRWKNIVNDSAPIRYCRSYSMPSLASNFILSKDEEYKSNRFSTTVVELYNLFTDLTNEYNDSVFSEKDKLSRCVQTTSIRTHDVDCQFPESLNGIRRKESRSRKNINVQYPGLGKIKLPHQLRTSIRHFIDTDNGFASLKFLENIPELQPKSFNRSSSTNRIREARSNRRDSIDDKARVLARCASECRHNRDNHGGSCHDMTAYPVQNNNLLELSIIEEGKSVSFCDLRPIPRKWGLGNEDNILAIFEVPSRQTVGVKTVEYEEENDNRIGGLVTNTIASIKALCGTISSSDDLSSLCDRFLKNSATRHSTASLLCAIEAIVALISDGLFLDSVHSKVVSTTDIVIAAKVTMRLWMFIEESCRSSLIKDVSHKLVFANLMKQVKQISSSSSAAGNSRPKESLAQVKLHTFIVMAIKTGILHIWLRSIVANDTILHRFFGSCSFFQQARTSYSNALSAVVVELRRLSTAGTTKVSAHISKPVKGKGRPSIARQGSNSSSSDNSVTKSRIPRLSKKHSIVATK